MTRKAFYERPFDFADFMSAWRGGEKMGCIGEFTFDIRMMIDHYTPEYYGSLGILVNAHLRKKYRVSAAFIRTYESEIDEDIERAWHDAYYDQWENDLITFLEVAMKDRADGFADGGTYHWTYEGKEVDALYEADGFRIKFTRKQFFSKFNRQQSWGYVSQQDCIDDPDTVFEDGCTLDIDRTQIDPDDFEGRYSHCPDVKDENILMFFDEYHDETPIPTQYIVTHHAPKVKGWITHRVPLMYRTPMQELNYS